MTNARIENGIRDIMFDQQACGDPNVKAGSQ